MTTKKKYEKPTMQVYDLPGLTRLLVGSGEGGFGGNPDYVPMP